jgi:hypothetical protein
MSWISSWGDTPHVWPFKSVIVSHAFPGPSERCSTCHQLVQYPYSDSFDYNNIHYLPALNNPLSLPPMEGALTFDNFVPVGDIGSFTPNTVVKSSDASFETSELFQPSLPFSENLQSMQSTTFCLSQSSSISPISPSTSKKGRLRRAILGTTMTSPSTRISLVDTTYPGCFGWKAWPDWGAWRYEWSPFAHQHRDIFTLAIFFHQPYFPFYISTSKKGHSRQASLGTSTYPTEYIGG